MTRHWWTAPGCCLAYKTLKGERIWVITEAADEAGKRAATTILKPDEY